MQKLVAYAGKALAAVAVPLNAAKDGYVKVIDWIAAHPHKTLWAAVGVLAVAVWL
jgi:hypothetical protein